MGLRVTIMRKGSHTYLNRGREKDARWSATRYCAPSAAKIALERFVAAYIKANGKIDFQARIDKWNTDY